MAEERSHQWEGVIKYAKRFIKMCQRADGRAVSLALTSLSHTQTAIIVF